MASLLKPASTYGTAPNMPYDDASPNQVVDLHLPNNGSTTRPLIVWIHGGGWFQGDEDSGCLPKDKGFVQRGFAVASVRYRLDSEATWPAQLVDVKAALRYLRAHAALWGLYSPKFGVWGASAGGHLAAMCAATNRVTKFDVGSYPHTSSDVTVAMDDYGITDVAAWANFPYGATPTPAAMVTSLLGAPAATVPDLAADASPMHWVSPRTAPTAILHGGADPLVPVAQSQTLYNALQAAGVASALTIVPGKGHADPALYTTGWLSTVAGMFDGWLRP